MGEPLDLELLISVTAGLGSFQEDEGGNEVYVKDDDCAACLRDLQRFLRQDDPQEREAFLALGKHNIAKTDLVPIIVTYPTDTELVYNALKVVTFMTMPVDALSDNRTLQVEYMQQVKEAFLGQDAMAVVVGLVADPLGRHPRMNEKDVLIVQLVIAFIRNLLCVPDRAADAGSKGDHKTRLRQELLERLFEDHVMELLILIAQHMHEHPFKKEAPLLLQIFHEIFKGIDPKEMLQATYTPPATRVSAKERPHGAGIATEKAILQREQRMIKASLQSRPMVRHARFGGVYVRRHVDDAMQTVLHSAHGGGLPSVARQARAKAATQVVEAEPRAKLAARLLVRMREYAEQFLEVSYDIMMGILRKDLEPGLNISRLDRVDFLRFLRLAHFFTAFLRMRQERDYKAQHAAKKAAPAAAPGPEADAEAAKAALSPFACISATMGFETFHMVQVLWLGIIDMPTKSEEKDWELQHASLSLLKEMLFTLDLATFAGNASDKKAADRLQRRLLHDDMKESGLLPVLGRLIKGFHYKFQPRSHAADLVEAIHVVLRMLDRLNTKEAGGFLVKRKAAVRRRKLPKTPAPAPPADPDAEANGETPGPAGDRPEGAPSAEKATPAPRAIPPEDGDAASAAGDSPASGSGQEREEQGTIAGGRVGDPFEEIEEEEEMEAARRRVKEVAYDVKQRVRQELAFPAVVHFYTWLLQGYSTNSTFLNHCILGFLKRIAHPDHLNLEPMLYQLSVLRLFHEILADDLFRKVPHAPELLHFCIGVTRNLFARLVPALPKAPDKGDELGDDMEVDVEGGDLHDKQEAEQRAAKEAKVKEGASSMMFIELMFWKNAKDSEQVRDEYNWKHLYDWEARQRDALHSLRNDQSDGELPGVGPARKRNGAFSLASRFSDAQLKQLRDLFEEHSAKKGYAAIIAEELGGGLKRSQVARQLKAMGFKQGVLTDTQKARLLELYEEFKYDKKYLTLIAEQLPGGWRKGQVGSQLRKLGLTKQRAPRAEGAGTGGKGKKVKKIKMPKVGADGQLLSSSESSSGSSSAGSGSDGSGSDGSGSASSGSDSDAEPQVQRPASAKAKKPAGRKGLKDWSSASDSEGDERRQSQPATLPDADEAAPSGGSDAQEAAMKLPVAVRPTAQQSRAGRAKPAREAPKPPPKKRAGGGRLLRKAGAAGAAPAAPAGGFSDLEDSDSADERPASAPAPAAAKVQAPLVAESDSEVELEIGSGSESEAEPSKAAARAPKLGKQMVAAAGKASKVAKRAQQATQVPQAKRAAKASKASAAAASECGASDSEGEADKSASASGSDDDGLDADVAGPSAAPAGKSKAKPGKAKQRLKTPASRASDDGGSSSESDRDRDSEGTAAPRKKQLRKGKGRSSREGDDSESGGDGGGGAAAKRESAKAKRKQGVAQDGGKVAKKAKQARVVVELGDNAKRAQSGEPGKRAAKKAKAGEGSAQAGVSGVQQDVLAAIKARRMRKQVPAQDQPGVQQPAADVDMADAPASADDELLALLEDEVAAGATQAPAAAAPAPAGQTDEDLLQDLLDEGDNGRNTETLPLRESVDAGNRPASELVAQPVAKRRILKKAVEPLATAAAAYEDLEDF